MPSAARFTARTISGALASVALFATACAPAPALVAPASPAAAAAAPSASAAAQAPCVAPAFRQLDFWVGDWDLVIRARKALDSDDWQEARGTNHVEVILGRCVVRETFQGDGPQRPWAGTSVSTYVPQAAAWRQTWVDDSGGYLMFEGGPTPEGFAIYGQPRDVNGQKVQMRMTWTHIQPGSLLWSWERGTPGGAQWTPMLQIEYARRR